MSELKYGVWEYSGDDSKITIFSNDGEVIDEIDLSFVGEDVGNLIAAAPNMLAVCEYINDAMNDGTAQPDRHLQKLVETAIAKVKGETP